MWDLTSRNWFGSIHPRRTRSSCAKPAQIPSGWPGQVLAQRIQSGSKLMCKNHQAQFWQNTKGPLPISHFQTRLCSSTDSPDHTVQNQPRSNLVLADCVRVWPNVKHPVRKQTSMQEPSGLHLANTSEPIRIRWESDLTSLLGNGNYVHITTNHVFINSYV